jgi:hypothetical protein
MTLGKVEGTEVGGANTGACDGLEDATLALTLVSNLEKEGGQLACRRPHQTVVWNARFAHFEKVSSIAVSMSIMAFGVGFSRAIGPKQFESRSVEQWLLTTRPILSSPVAVGLRWRAVRLSVGENR